MKADGYGHGAVRVARAALEAGAEGLCVALAAEGVALRDAGIDAPILVLSRAAGRRWRRTIVANDLTPTVYTRRTFVDALVAAEPDASAACTSRSTPGCTASVPHPHGDRRARGARSRRSPALRLDGRVHPPRRRRRAGRPVHRRQLERFDDVLAHDARRRRLGARRQLGRRARPSGGPAHRSCGPASPCTASRPGRRRSPRRRPAPGACRCGRGCRYVKRVAAGQPDLVRAAAHVRRATRPWPRCRSATPTACRARLSSRATGGEVLIGGRRRADRRHDHDGPADGRLRRRRGRVGDEVVLIGDAGRRRAITRRGVGRPARARSATRSCAASSARIARRCIVVTPVASITDHVAPALDSLGRRHPHDRRRDRRRWRGRRPDRARRRDGRRQDRVRPGLRPGARRDRADHVADVHAGAQLRRAGRRSTCCTTPTSTASTALHEVADLALGELAEFDGIVLVEWGDVVEATLGEHLVVRLEHDDDATSTADEVDGDLDGSADDVRSIEIAGVGRTWASRWSSGGRRGRGVPMLILGIETATEQVSVAIGGHEGVHRPVRGRRGRRHAETLMPAIEFVCDQADIGLDEIGVVAVDVGPGLFTGMRVGLATGQGDGPGAAGADDRDPLARPARLPASPRRPGRRAGDRRPQGRGVLRDLPAGARRRPAGRSTPRVGTGRRPGRRPAGAQPGRAVRRRRRAALPRARSSTGSAARSPSDAAPVGRAARAAGPRPGAARGVGRTRARSSRCTCGRPTPQINWTTRASAAVSVHRASVLQRVSLTAHDAGERVGRSSRCAGAHLRAGMPRRSSESVVPEAVVARRVPRASSTRCRPGRRHYVVARRRPRRSSATPG